MSLDDIKNTINKKFKSEILGFGVDMPGFERIPFSSPRLNYLTRGGLPRPGGVELSGAEGSGKTTLLGDIIKNAQKQGLLCSFTDTENKVDLDYWKFLGVDTDNVLVCRPIGMSGEDVLQLQMDMLNEGVQVLGLDSLASLVPKAVLLGDMTEKTYCGSSGIVSTFSQKLTGSGILTEKGAVMIGINQVRDKLSGFGLQTPGGHFWRHACVCRLQLMKGNPFNSDYKELPLSTVDEVSGHVIEARLLKNQFMKNDRRFTTMTLHYEKGIDVVEDGISVAIDLEVIDKAGAWYRLVNKEAQQVLCIDGEELKFQGRVALRQYLDENPRIVKWMVGQIDKYITED